MWFINVMQSFAGRVLKIALGIWLLVEGSAGASLAGLVMMMGGVVLTVTAIANIPGPGHGHEHRA